MAPGTMRFPDESEVTGEDARKQLLFEQLEQLRLLVNNLPSELPEGPSDGPIQRYFGSIDIDRDEGPYYTVDQAWTRTFQSLTPDQREALITRGPHGAQTLYEFFRIIAADNDVDKYKGGYLIAKRCFEANQLILRAIRTVRERNPSALAQSPALHISGEILPLSSLDTRAKQGSSSSSLVPFDRVLGKRKSGTLNERPRSSLDTPAFNAAIDRVLGAKPSDNEVEVESANRKKIKRTQHTKDSTGPPQSADTGNLTTASAREVSPIEVIDDGDDDADTEQTAQTRRGRPPQVSQWARAHFGDQPKARQTKEGNYVWEWHCNWCNVIRNIPRSSAKLKKFDDDPKSPSLSNLISHLRKQCKKIPDTASYDAQTSSSEQVDNTTSAAAGQRQMMKNFVQRGIENPKVDTTPRTPAGFRERFVKAIIRDDLPFIFGEKKGIQEALQYVIPKGYDIPNGTMVSRDVDRLYEVIDTALSAQMKGNKSKIAFATDAWTSKNSVYAFIGLVAFWINDDWELVECPIALIPVDGDHSGAASAKAIFVELIRRGILPKYLAHAADNTSSNGTLTESLCHRIMKLIPSMELKPSDCQIGCGCHVGNLSVQDLLHGLGLAVSPEDEDLYLRARESLTEDMDKSDIAEEENLAKHELLLAAKGKLPETSRDVADSDSELSEAPTPGNLSGDDDVQVAMQAPPAKRKRTPSVVDQLHAIVVDVLRSEPRRKKMREIIRNVCSLPNQGLTLIRGMPIRWNSTLAEIRRALLLQSAINLWVETLPHGLRGQKKSAAIRKQEKWHIDPKGWKFLNDLVYILEPFENFTLSLSKQDIPSLPQLLPLYKHLQLHLQSCLSDVRFASPNIQKALKMAEDKLNKHLKIALTKTYALLAAVLHPAIRLKYFQSENWDDSVAERAEKLLKDFYTRYSASSTSAQEEEASQRAEATSSQSAPKSIFASAIFSKSTSRAHQQFGSEIKLYFSGAYPIREEDSDKLLEWWKIHENIFPILACIARDILAIPAVSVSVERLFSSCKHTMSDARSSFKAMKAARTVITKEWLKRGLGEGANYLDGVSIWRQDN